MRVIWTRRYLRELGDIGDYIAEKNPRAAARIVRDIHAKTQSLLSANPFIGRIGEIMGTRELVIPATGYVVAYRVHDENVEVLFVQHGAREWPRKIE
ncbi:type II toxin-antitoxin system RelE/ParE family toxin [Agrobacterium larrymoorei]|uniref:Type II toxin-antitoxin system RelE/ParE family toxin n=1 Tax=Agrobacterium larrymoorei TaxID=160699 RepID=A0AAF0KIY2_9HYPH|nr:type II toxin-antitoxin system RelE/ParE family toxin [Agrobacterium larrymoorei]WHA41549.1 type II toxin-antitoxin system RelE/ParE family toxin [Agrobacterium larrymoorei]